MQLPSPLVQETQLSGSRLPLGCSSAPQNELNRYCAGKNVSSRSSTAEKVQRKAKLQALPNHSTLQSSRYDVIRKSLKQRRECPLEKIQVEISPLLDDGDKCSSGEAGILKRTTSTASTISHDSSRSSGYYSNPYPRTDYYDQEVEDCASKLKQTRRDSVEDEGVVTDHSTRLQAESPESGGTESSSPPSSESPSKRDGTTVLAAAEEQDDLQPMLRHERCSNQIHKRRQLPELTDTFAPEIDEMRRKRSSSLPATAHARCVKAQQNAMYMHGVNRPRSEAQSYSSSIASVTSGEWLIYLLHG